MTRHRHHFLSYLERWRANGTRLLRWAVLPALCLLSAPQAFGESQASIKDLTFPVISVASDGHHYYGVTEIAYEWTAWIDIDAQGLFRVKAYRARPWSKAEGFTLTFNPFEAAKIYRWAPGRRACTRRSECSSPTYTSTSSRRQCVTFASTS